MKFTPHWYQREATQFILDTPRCNLWLPMGAGKTTAVISALDILHLAGSNYFPALVIAPKRVAEVVWSGEVYKWDCFKHLRVIKIMGTQKERRDALKAKKADIYVTNYDNLIWLERNLGKQWPFGIVILDESTRVKGFRLSGGGLRAWQLSKIVKHTGRWINLTGTPVTNGLTDLWGQMWFVDYGERLGRTYTQFMERYFRTDDYTHKVHPLPGAEDEIHAAIGDVVYALRLEQCLPDVSKPLHVPIEVELPPSARKLYDTMEKDFFVELGDGIEAPTAAVKSMKLLQLASGAIYDSARDVHPIHDAKIDALKELAEDCAEPLLVAYHFKFDIPRIQKVFPKARVLQGEKDISDWNQGKIQMLLAHPASAGHGINLAAGGRNIVFFSHDWNLETRQQIIERLGPARQAQLKTGKITRIFDIVAKDTLDSDVLECTAGKLTVQQALVNARSRRL